MSQQYEPLNDTGKHSMFRLSFGKFALGVVSLPFAAFIFCIAWSVLYDFTASTSTHCGVPNYLPSISAAIGNYQPQRIVWQSAILLQALPRLLIAHQYVRHYTQIIRGSYRKLAYVACALNTFENIALIGLTLRTSSADYEAHKFFFIVFIAAADTYMLISYLLNQYFRKPVYTLTFDERKSLQLKKYLFYVNIVSFTLAIYFFGRHNNYCEPYVYTLFALLEYFVVLTNMGFHMTAYWDFNDKLVTADCVNGFHMITSNQYHYNRLNY